MKATLVGLLDKPVILRTLPKDAGWQPLAGVVFEVRDDSVDLLTSVCTMRTVRLEMIVDVSLDSNAAQGTLLEAPPAAAEYPRARRALFEAEQAILLRQPEASIKARAEAAVGLLRAVRNAFPTHVGTEELLERAHFLARGGYDYELEPAVLGGELVNHNYSWAKERMAALDEAMKFRRPEDEVATQLIRLARYAGRALAKYPAHAELKAWFEKAERIRKKLSDEVQRSNKLTEPFVPGKD